MNYPTGLRALGHAERALRASSRGDPHLDRLVLRALGHPLLALLVSLGMPGPTRWLCLAVRLMPRWASLWTISRNTVRTVVTVQWRSGAWCTAAADVPTRDHSEAMAVTSAVVAAELKRKTQLS